MANGPALGWNGRAVDARLREAFEAFDAAADPEWSPVRQAAFGRLRELGIPTARHEAFTYANPAPWFGSAGAEPFFAPAPPSAPRDRSPALPVCPNALCMRFPGDGENLLEEEIVRAALDVSRGRVEALRALYERTLDEIRRFSAEK